MPTPKQPSVLIDDIRSGSAQKIRQKIREAILPIEQQAFENAWSEEDFCHCLRQRNAGGQVAILDAKVAGFIIHELVSETQFLILTFAVAADRRRQGIGTRLVQYLIDTLKRQHRDEIIAQVRERNLPAQRLFRKLGFRCTEIIADAYDDIDESGYLMRFQSKTTLEIQSPFHPSNRITGYFDSAQ